MGVEMLYQAIPANCGLTNLARADIQIAVEVWRIPYWFSQAERRPSPGSEGFRGGPLWSWCWDLAGQYPDLKTLNCSLDRRWDALHYLLSATRRGEPVSHADLAFDRAFDSGELVAEHARAVQGAPVRYMGPAATRKVADVLESLSYDDLKARYQPTKMEANCVYKFWADRADEAEWTVIVRYFDNFRSFFFAVASLRYGVIVVRD